MRPGRPGRSLVRLSDRSNRNSHATWTKKRGHLTLRPEESHDGLRAWLLRHAAVLLDGRLRGKVDASDVVQDVLLKDFAHREQFRGASEGERKAWLRRILANTLADLVRRYLQGRKRDVGQECSLEELARQSSERVLDVLADGRAEADAVERQEQVLWLAEGLAALPEDQREAVRLRYIEGLAVGDVGRRMGKSPAAVAGLVRRGLAALRGRPGGP